MGTNNFQTKNPGDVINTDDPNQYKVGLTGDIVPRNVSGVPSDIAGSLGSSVFRWLNGFVKALRIGEIASGIELKETSGELDILVGGSTRARVGANGWDGVYIKNGTIPSNKNTLNIVNGSNFINGSYNNTSYAAIPGATVTITTTGRPVLIMPQNGYVDNTTASESYIRIMRSGTQICEYRLHGGSRLAIPIGAYSCIDNAPSAGTYTYTMEFRNASGANTNIPGGCFMTALEV